MKLNISFKDRHFFVDDKSKTGSPTIGRGRSIKEAIGDYVHHNQKDLGIVFIVEESALPGEIRRIKRELGER